MSLVTKGYGGKQLLLFGYGEQPREGINANAIISLGVIGYGYTGDINASAETFESQPSWHPWVEELLARRINGIAVISGVLANTAVGKIKAKGLVFINAKAYAKGIIANGLVGDVTAQGAAKVSIGNLFGESLIGALDVSADATATIRPIKMAMGLNGSVKTDAITNPSDEEMMAVLLAA